MGTVLDSNIKALACKICIVAKTAANTSTAAGTFGNDGGIAAGNYNTTGISTAKVANKLCGIALAAANACAAITAGGSDRTASDCDVVGITAIGYSAADASAACTAGGGQGAGGVGLCAGFVRSVIIFVVCDGQLEIVI